MKRRTPLTQSAYDALIDAARDLLELADAWASCGPETYTPEERRTRDAAERILERADGFKVASQ